MGTAFSSFVINHNSEANFRIWGKGISDLIKAAGAVQTADTGQIDWATVVFPASAVGGYEVFKLTDSVGDLYIKIGYGGYSQTTYPALRITLSTMPTDGAMNFTDTRFLRDIGVWSLGSVSNATLRNSYVCVTGTTLAIQMGEVGMFSIERRRDRVTGLLASSPDFIVTEHSPGSSGVVFSGSATLGGFFQVVYRMAPSITYGSHREMSFVPWSITTSGTPDKNIYRWYALMPSTHILVQGVTYIWAEIANDVIFSCAPVGGISHTYRTTGLRGCANTNDANYAAAMIWE